MTATPFRPAAGGVRVAVRLTPKAGRSGVRGLKLAAGGAAELDVAVTAPADRGRANAALIELLAGLWQVPAGRIALVAGRTARHKCLHVAEAPATLLPRLEDWLATVRR